MTSAPLDVGDQLPDITLPDDQGRPVRLRDHCADQTLILFFYPRDGGLLCRTQACELRDNWPLLRSAAVEVMGVNNQDEQSHAQFRERYGLPFPLLVDRDLTLARAFGFAHPRMPLYKMDRATVIVDPGGTIRAALRNVKPTAHFDMLKLNLDLAGEAPAT